MSEETFVRELERRADDVRPLHLGFEDVRASAHRIRRRRRAAAAGATAAVVAAVLLGPGLVGGSPPSHAPEPAPPVPTTTPGQKVPYGLDAPVGDAPRVLYERPQDSVVIDGSGEHALPDGTLQVVPYGDGYLAVADGDSPLEGKQRLYRLDAGFTEVEDLGPVLYPVAFSPDGSLVAWTEVADDTSTELVVTEDTEVVQRVPFGVGQLAFPAGFTADGTVYNFQGPDSQLGFWEVSRDGEATRVRGLEYVWDASPTTDLVVGNTRYDDEENRPCAGAVRGDLRIWEQCWYLLEDLSPDGSLVIGYPDEGTPNHAELTLLDAETAEPVLRFVGGRRASIVEAAWEDSEHLLAVVQHGGRQAILRFGLDGTVERTTDPVEVDELRTEWFLAGRPF